MNPKVQIVLIIAAAVVIVLIIYKNRLSKFKLKANEKGVETELNADDGKTQGNNDGIVISGNKQIGKDNKIKVSSLNKAKIDKNTQKGDRQEIDVSGK
jgi:hypothetical protein